MKTNITYHEGKPPSLEEGPMRYVRMNEDSYQHIVEKKDKCNRCIPFVKVILYVELALFVGWLGCIILANHYVHNTDNSVSELYDNNGAHDYNDRDSLLILEIKNSEEITRMRENHNHISSERSETTTELMIQRKSESGDIGTSRTATKTMMKTPSATADGGAKPNYTILMSLIKKLNENSPEYEDYSSDEISSVRNRKEEEGLSPWKILMAKNFKSKSTTLNFFNNFDATNYPFSDTDSDDVYPRKFRQDALWLSDNSNVIPALEKDFFQTNRFPDLRFDFEDPDNLMEGYMSRRTRAMAALTVDSSSSSSEQMKNPAPKAKRAADSLSSSSSSSSSFDSSSNETNETPARATKEGLNFPEIVDDQGNTIDDPKDVINHIKRNSLETPMPDCPENKSTKIVTLDEAETSNRHVRSAEAVKNREDKCVVLFNTMRDNVLKITHELVPGEDSDVDIEELRRIFMAGVTFATVRVVATHTIVGINLNNQRMWEDTMSDLRQNLTEAAQPEHRVLIRPNTPEMAIDLRKISDFGIALHHMCRDSMKNMDLDKRSLRSVMMNIEYGICSMRWEMMERKQKSLANELVTGVPRAKNNTDIYEIFKRKIHSMARTIAQSEQNDSPVAKTSPLSITDEQWRNMLIDLRMVLAKGPETQMMRQHIRDSNPPTEQQAKDLHDILEYYLRHYSDCRSFEALSGKFENGYEENEVTRKPEEIKP